MTPLSGFRPKVLLLSFAMVACAPSMEARSAGEVGCSPDEISISDDSYHFGLVQTGESWVASCRGHTFVCSQLNESGHNHGLFDNLFASDHVNCTEEAESSEERRNREGYVADRKSVV